MQFRKELAAYHERPLVIGHRGYPIVAPENTRLSFDRALQAGVDGIITDNAAAIWRTLALHKR